MPELEDPRAIDVLLVEDDEGDVLMTREAFEYYKIRNRLHVVGDGDHWLFSFRDNGIGIGPEYADRIFVIFQRLHDKATYPGTGIGLAMVKKIIEYHDGRIWLDTTVTTGARFWFTLPVFPEDENADG